MSGPKPERDPVAEYLALKQGTAHDPVSDYLNARTAPADATAAQPRMPDRRQLLPHTTGADVLGAAYKAVQGGSLGLGKYAAAGGVMAGDRLKGGKMPYEAALDEVEDVGREFDYNHPALSTAANIAGSIPTARFLPTTAGKVAQIANPTLRAGVGFAANTAENAGYGAASGFFSQDGDLATRARAAASGAKSGAVLGAGIGAARMLGSGVLNATSRPSEGSGLGRATSGFVAPVEDQARGAILKDIARDKTSVGNLITDAQAAGNAPSSLVDLGGENLAGRARGVQSMPGPAKQQMAKDLQGARRQLPGFMRDETRIAAGVNPVNAEALANSHASLAKTKAAPLYEKAYQTAPIDDPTLLEAFKDDDFRRAYNTGRRIAAKEPTPVNLPPLEDVLAGKTGMPVQGFDYAKQGLDDVIQGRMTNGKMGKREARALRLKLNDVLGEVDQMRPEYAAARNVFRGEKELEEAATEGGTFLNMDDRQVRQALRGYTTQGEQEAFRSAALDNVMQVYRSSDNPGVMINKIAGSDIKREALKALIGGNPKYAELQSALDRSEQIARRANMVLGGSPTMRIAAEQQDVASAAKEMGSGVLRGDAKGIVLPVLRRSYNRVVNGETERFGEKMAPMLTAGTEGGSAGQAARVGQLRNLQESQERAANRTTNAAKVTRAGAQVAGQNLGTTDMHSLLQPLPSSSLPPDYAERAKSDPWYRAYLKANGVPVP